VAAGVFSTLHMHGSTPTQKKNDGHTPSIPVAEHASKNSTSKNQQRRKISATN